MSRFSTESMRSRAKELSITNPLPKSASRSIIRRTLGSIRSKTSFIEKEQAIKTGASMIPDLNILISRVRKFPDDHFIYLSYMLPKQSEYFTPYSLEEMIYDDLPNKLEYYTMSRNGVTYWSPSENFFTPLLQWQQEFQMYLSIIKIRSFAVFRIWKGFKSWEKTIKWKKINNARQYLEENLFIANISLGRAILNLRSEIVNMEKLNFINVTVIEECYPFYFLEEQMRIYEKLRTILTEFHERTQNKILIACTTAIGDKGFFPDDEVNFYPSLKKMRDAMNFIDRAKKRNFCKLLSNFLTYCDNHIFNFLHKITTNSFRDLVKALESHDSVGPSMEELKENQTLHEQLEKERPEGAPQSPFFLADLLLLTDRIDVEPSEEIMKTIFMRISSLILETVTEIPNLTDDKIFNKFTEPSIMGRQEERLAVPAPDLNFLLRGDREFNMNRKAIFNYIHSAYEKAATYTQRFETIRTNYEIDTHTNATTLNTERDLDKLRAYCERYCNNVLALDGILSTVNLGLLRLSQSSFKEAVTPVCYNLQNVLATYLPKLAAEKIKQIAEATEDLLQRINAEPETTLDIVAHIRFLDTVDDELSKLFEEVDYAHDCLIIIRDYDIPIDDEVKEDYMDCEDLVNRTSDRLNEVRDNRAEFIDQLDRKMQDDIVLIFDEINEIGEEVKDPMFLNKLSDPEEVKLRLNGLLNRINDCQERAREHIVFQKEFKIEITHYGSMNHALEEVRLRLNLWNSLEEWETTLEQWNRTQFTNLNVEELNNLTTKIIKNCMQFEKYLPPNAIVTDLRESAEAFKLKLPVIGYLRNPNFRPRHWTDLEVLLGRRVYMEDNVFISTYEQAHAFEEDLANNIMEISSQATGEAQLENMLKNIENVWKDFELSIVSHHDSKDVFILAGTDELRVMLDDSCVNINTIAASKFVGPISTKVDDWIAALDLFGETLEVWLTCQTSWIYLEAIFASPDIQRQLPQEAKMFNLVDKNFKDIVRNAKKISIALTVMTNEETFKTLKENNRLLDLITRGLEAYLEVKRVVFPRFYFLSNDELLEILAQTRVPQAVQPHLRKCFDAIYRLEFGQKDEGGKMVPTNDILSMISPEGEKLLFGKGLKARGAVEEWLSKVEEAMFLTTKRYMRFGYICYPAKERDEWFQDHPNQIVLTVSQQQWAAEIHVIFEHPLKPNETYLERLQTYERICFKNLAALAALTRKDISSLLRKILCALITIDVHAKDSVNLLIDKKVTKATDFNWLKMLRFYWSNETDTIYSHMASANIPYYYEYLGAGGVLVLTPLTDRCYLCLMGALQMDLGGAPAGPAGTGKTETTKDLAKAVAKQCVVFNCSDGLDYKMMGRFFSGLAQCGAWCCFDEFNRIDIEVLSVIAQQLITIRNAKVLNAKRFIFEGREIKLIKSCAVFITMNPGYAGRTELPDNLKALFRPISMMVPDYALISEVILYSEGFEYPKILAHKMVQMYKLCSEQLSQQNHYDFGMRAVKSVLVMAGALKRSAPDQREDITLIAALRDSNIPKFLADDALLFRGILSDLFPGIELPDSSHPDLEQGMELGLRRKNMQATGPIIRKCIQLYETMCVRWGVMLVGPTGSGKSTILHALEFALTHLFENGVPGANFRSVAIQTMNPKSVTMNELYGFVDLKTLEWQDGLLGLAVRAAVKVEEEIHQWIVCDGPVDAVWIENLNTVLDDNKMLCLANSERIKLTPWVHMIFEVQDLAVASPATVSRCGMVYVDPFDLGWKPIIETWKTGPIEKKLSPDQMEYLNGLFQTYFAKLLRIADKNGSFLIHQVTSAKVLLCCELLSSLIEQLRWHGITSEEEYKPLLVKMFTWCLLWSIASNFRDAEKSKFETLMREVLEAEESMEFPPSGTIWDYRIDIETRKWDNWSKMVEKFEFNPSDKYFDMQVPTVDTTKYGYVAELLFKRNFPVMFTGDTGVGKSVLAISTLKKLSKGKVVPVLLNFSAQTSSQRTQEMVEAPLEKRRRAQLAAPIGKTVIIFIDDVNMPKLETYGAQAPIELLRQFLDFKGFYDREKLFWKEIIDVVLGCACAPPGGGRNPLTPRFVRHFALFSLPKPNDETLTTIFNGILTGFLNDFSAAIRPLSTAICNACVDVYVRISQELLPTPDKSHYVFNLRDLSKCIQGILQASNLYYNTEMQVLRLFYHETTRVFHDRLINEEDKHMFKELMTDVCMKHFGKQVLKTGEPTILFGDFMVFGQAREQRCYEEIKDHGKLESILLDYVEDYNVATGKSMKLILFQDALEHTVRLARLLRSDRGNGLLVGVAGMGKQSLTRLAAHVNDYKCLQIELKRNYDINTFHEDLRVIYRIAGVDNKPVVFLMIDTQIVEEEFLEDINNILNSGEVPNLFEGDEYEKVILDARDPCNASSKGGCNRDEIYKFFINNVRNNLHVVISMSPVGDAFRRRCRMFPSLVNCCTIDWFTNWPIEALYSVALVLLKELSKKPQDREALAVTTVFMHKTVEDASEKFYKEMKRRYYTTPSSYLELLKLYQSLLKTKTDEVIAKRKRISNGLNKLLQTNDIIAVMQKELEIMVPQLDIKSAKMKELLEGLAIQTKMVDQVKESVMRDEVVAKEKAAISQAISDDASKDLEIAMPALREAEEALKSISKADLNELKAFTTPPQLVQFVMEAVCILLGVKPTWASAKQTMADINFIKRLFEYDKEHIKEDTLKKVKKYIEHKDFVPAKIEKVSKVCKSVSLWVIAMEKFSKVYKVVEPKIIRQAAAEAELKSVLNLLRAKQEELAAVEAKIQMLQDDIDVKSREFKVVQDAVDLTYGRINRAGRLTSALSDEEVRWKETVLSLTQELSALPGDVLVSAACVAYLGAFSSEYRYELCKQWVAKCHEQNIPSSDEFHLLKVLGDPYEMRSWTMDGLPKDNISIENGLYATRALRWPLMIDPQEQANRWIRNMERANKLQVLKITDANLLRVLDNSVRQGYPVMLEDLDETLDPSLRPILQRETFVSEGRVYIKLGDTIIDYDKNFKLYMTTKLANPHYLPEICINVTLVNFLVTESGLEDQLLADIVAIELPALEIQRNDLIVRINTDKQQLLALEDKVLKLLYQSQGDILDDEELVETLNESKETSLIIATRLIDTEETEKVITAKRELYRSLATRGASLYFVIAGLAEIDPMYQYSLKYFSQVFCNVIRLEHPKMEIDARIFELKISVLKALYDNVSRGLFGNHKLILSFLLCMAVEKQEGRISSAEFGFLLRGMVGSVKRRSRPREVDMSDFEWETCIYLEENFPQQMEGLTQELQHPFYLQLRDSIEVFNFTNSKEKPSDKLDKRLTNFFKLMFIRVFRTEKFLLSVVTYLHLTIGQYFTEVSAAGSQLKVVYLDTSNVTPLVFVLSSGSDPMSSFLKFAEEMKYLDKFYSISLGQGQGPIAENLIEKSVRLGHWVFLQNCHLATSWMRQMENIVRNITLGITKAHPDFRLYFSSMPIKSFPISVLQNSVKITNEPPKGIKANVLGALNDINADFFEKHVLKNKWRAIVFGLCMFHAVILERRKFGPLGWNILYEFNESDRECGLKTLDFFIDRKVKDEIPWDAIFYINGEITWGGRVTDYWDLRCLRSILKIFSSNRILDPDYKYCRGDPYYCDPKLRTVTEYYDYVSMFPPLEDPEIFGMNQNANIVFQTKETNFFVNTLLMGQPRSAADEGQAQENDICLDVIAKIQDVLVRKIIREGIHESLIQYDNKGQLPSLTTVLVQEIDRYNISLKIIHESLHNLKKAIKGLVVMSDILEEVFKSLLNNLVPQLWAKKSFLSIKPLPSYIIDYQRRVDCIQDWQRNGNPRSYWLSGFFFPQSFLTGVLQTHARKRVLPIDSLKIDFHIIERVLIQQDFFERRQAQMDVNDLYGDLPESNEAGVNVHGIFIEAARWSLSNGGLCDALNGELYSRLPVVRFIPCLELTVGHRYDSPLYKTQSRSGVLSTTGHSTNFILSMLLHSRQSPDYWILRGTALVSGVAEDVC